MRRLLLGGIVLALASPASALATHSGDLDCSDFPNQAAAQQHFDAHPGDPDDLDNDDPDIVACESRPCPCAAPGGSVSPPPPPPPVTPPPVAPPPPPPVAPPPPPPPSSTPTPSVERHARTFRGVVVLAVVDGDTLKVRLRTGKRRTVRLVGIDAPETSNPVECGSRGATKHMTGLVMRRRRGRLVGRPATLTTDPTQAETDRYGRLLAYVGVAGLDVGRRMIAAGWAMPYIYGGVAFQRVDAYRAAGRAAQARGAGVHGACGGDAPGVSG